MIKASNDLNNVSLVKLVNRMIWLIGFELDVFIASSLIKFYAENN